jgi:hypothetical protein
MNPAVSTVPEAICFKTDTLIKRGVAGVTVLFAEAS